MTASKCNELGPMPCVLSFASQNPLRQSELVAAVAALDPGSSVLFASNEAVALELLPQADILLAHRYSPELHAHAKSLRWVHLSVAGIEKSLFRDFVNSEITLTNSRGLHARPMAEWVMAALYYWAQNFSTAGQWQLAREWREPKKKMTEQRRTVKGLKALVVGYGEVGKGIATLLRDNGLSVEAVATRPRHDGCEVYAMEYLEERLEEADVVVLTLPATHRTLGLFNRRLFPLMKEGSVFVNVARGSLVDEDDLLAALESGKPGFALLDVFREEPLPENSPLFGHPQIFMTPHVSGNFPEYTRLVHDLFMANFARYLEGEPLQYVVDKKRGY